MTERPKRRGARESREFSDLPGNFRRSLERAEVLDRDVSPGADLSAEIASRVAEVTAAISPFDAVHLLGHFFHSELTTDQEYVESEHPGAVYIVELVAAVLLERPSRLGSADPEPPIQGRTLSHARDRLREITLLEGERRSRQTAATALGTAQARTAVQHLMLRGPGWADQESALLLDLFAPDRLARKLRDRLGFDAGQAVACIEALQTLVWRQRGEYLDSVSKNSAKATRWFNEVRTSTGRVDPRALKQMALGLWALQNVGEALIFTPERLAQEAGVAPPAAKAFVARLATPFGQSGDLFQRAGCVRLQPYLDLGDGRYFPAAIGDDMWALRGVFQEALAGSDAYLRHRGRWLEDRSASLLVNALAPDEVHQGVKIRRSGVVLGEIDVLLRIGGTAITVEAKSATMRPSARRGGEALIKHLEGVVKKSAEQAALAGQALTGDHDIDLVDRSGRPLSVGYVREVLPVVITLDDLSAVAPVLWRLLGYKLLPTNINPPWIVTVYELDIIARILQWPMQLVHYLRRRARLNEIAGLDATDELDWWMFYLAQGLYFEDEDPAADGQVLVLSQTDALDAWYLSERGRHSPAPKPKQDLDVATEAMLNWLAATRPQGWVGAGCALLEISGDARGLLHAQIAEARTRAAARGAAQRGALGFGDTKPPFLLCWAVCPDDWSPHLPDILGGLVRERLHQLDVQTAYAFGVYTSSPHPLDSVLVVESNAP